MVGWIRHQSHPALINVQSGCVWVRAAGQEGVICKALTVSCVHATYCQVRSGKQWA